MSDRWARLVDAVGTASALDAVAAAAHLSERLEDDPALLAEAREILAGGLEGDAFLRPQVTAPRASAPALVEGAAVGPFHILRLLGEGGMGSVFLAQQAHPQRHVALKLLSSTLLSKKARARFEYEVQALASLRHRGIAQVYEAGVHSLDDGLTMREVPWFAMEYVEDARTVLAYAEDCNLSIRERLTLYLEVLDAVHHGHQKGVVHRDLKPDNVLVNAAGHPKVIDFGVAKQAELGAPVTTVGGGVPAIVGTLPYLAPERVTSGRDAADVRSDVYALGVTLFQLLTGRLPITVDMADIVTSARRICEEAPPLPSSANAALPRDLDAVVLKTLAKDPNERYASVDAVADDIRRFLEHRPVNARAPGALYHARLFARRHRVLVISGAAVLGIGIAATLLSVNWALRSEQSEQRATLEKAQALEQRSRAEKLFRTVFRRSFDATIREAPELQKQPGTTERVKAMMDKVLEDLRVLESMAGDEPRVRVLIAEAWLTLGDTQGNRVYANLGDPEAAQASYRHALVLLDQVLAAQPDHLDARLAAVRGRIRLSDVLDQAQRTLMRRGERDPNLTVERRALLESALVDARAAFAAHPTEDKPPDHLVDVHARVGRFALQEKAFAVAREHACAIEDLHAAGRIDSPIQGLLLRAWSHYAAEDWEAAHAAWTAVVASSAKPADAQDATHTARFAHAQNLGVRGTTAFLAGHRVEAATTLQEVVARLQKLVEEAPKDRRIGIQLYIQLTELVRVYRTLAAEDDAANRDAWLGKQRDTLQTAIDSLGPAEDGNRHRTGMRQQLQEELDSVNRALGD